MCQQETSDVQITLNGKALQALGLELFGVSPLFSFELLFSQLRLDAVGRTIATVGTGIGGSADAGFILIAATITTIRGSTRWSCVAAHHAVISFVVTAVVV